MAEAGRPEQLILAPEVSDVVMDYWLQGHSTQTIADRVVAYWAAKGRIVTLTKQSVDSWINRHLIPVAKAYKGRSAGAVLLELSRIKALCYDRLHDCFLGLTEETLEFGSPSEDEKAKVGKELSGKMLDAKDALAGLAIVKRTVKRIPNNTMGAFLQAIAWCIEQEAKICGHYKATKISIEGEFRVAGFSPQEVDSMYVQKLVKKLEERRIEMSALQIHDN